MQEVCGAWAGRKRLVAARSGERVTGVDRVILEDLGFGKRGMWTNGDMMMLWRMVERRVDRVVWFGYVEYQLETEARKKVREAQARANEAWQERQRLNVDDAASFLVELGRLAAVDEWERGRMGEIRAEGERRRHEHRQEGAAALSRMVDRGETLTAIAGLAGVKVSEVRAVLKSAGGQPIASPDAVGAASAVADAPESAHQVVRDDAVRRVSVGELPNVEGLRG